MSSKYLLDHILSTFAGELLSFVQRASDSISALKRTVEQRPSAGVQDFKECLDDLEEQVSDFTEEIQQLVTCTSDTTSLEELIGHCTAVYHANRTAALQLEQHLSQYGYQQPAGAVLEPENPDDFIQQDDQLQQGMYGAAADALEPPMTVLGRLSCKAAAGHLSALGSMQQQRQAYSTPTSPVSKLSLASLKPGLPTSRLGSSSQPGSPTGGYRGPGVGGLWGPAAAAAAPGLGDTGPARAGPPGTQLKPPQQDRSSFGTTSSTPPGLLMSPGVAALANKYATSSVGGSSVGCLSTGMGGSQPSTGPVLKQLPAGRDLSLTYGLDDSQSPDLPIFGRAAAAHPSHHHQQQGLTAAACDATADADQTTPDAAASSQQSGQLTAAAAAAKAGAAGDDEDTTGQLYSSLIHSNMGGMSSRDVDMQEDQAEEPVTPRAGASCPGTPKAPGTAGRLPAQWHSKKMQELDSLQADLTITLSQMKRTPSRSRLASRAAWPEDSDEDEEQPQQQQRQQATQQQQQLPGRTPGRAAGASSSTAEDAGDQAGQTADQVQHGNIAAAAAASMQPPPSAGGTNLQRLRQRLQEQQQLRQQQQQQEAAAPALLAATTHQPSRSSRNSAAPANAAAKASAAVSSAAAAAAAATADLESLMESLSRKYAADAAAAAADAEEDSLASPASVDDMSAGSLPEDREELTPAAGAAEPAAAAAAEEEEEEEDGLSAKGLLTVELLNGALEELAELAAGRAGKRALVSCEGFTAADLELLGHSSSKSKTLVSCLHKLGRASLQRSAAGSNVYKLVGAPIGSSSSSVAAHSASSLQEAQQRRHAAIRAKDAPLGSRFLLKLTTIYRKLQGSFDHHTRQE
ncbi:hypothetical protein OEZ86_013029 [Tetradesmus obliquus]|nr:hypothetical protein OEZ86_013029 [Tetradesmus obliquus]